MRTGDLPQEIEGDAIGDDGCLGDHGGIPSILERPQQFPASEAVLVGVVNNEDVRIGSSDSQVLGPISGRVVDEADGPA